MDADLKHLKPMIHAGPAITLERKISHQSILFSKCVINGFFSNDGHHLLIPTHTCNLESVYKCAVPTKLYCEV